MSHAHDHAHHQNHLSYAMWMTALLAVVELAGGWWAHSLALLADAGHMLSDIVALGLAVVAGRIARRPAHAGMTYGYGRARVLAAQANGLGLWFLSGWIVWEAFGRLVSPPDVQGRVVMAIAILGLAVNLIVLRWLHGGEDINTRAAYWHVLGDALGSVAAMIAGAVILLTGWMPIDPILSFVVAAILTWGGWRLVRETTLELMEGVPPGINLSEIETLMGGMEGIRGIHHLHVWPLPNGQLGLSAHVQVMRMTEWPTVLPRLLQSLHEQGIEHATLQPEDVCAEQGCG
ncbi:MAG TPA: cation diffusion facilitator family transporter [Mariprofundaceae bacterium]|nr:cation diffusion facilitator family transporter [Mariprofundaceae bacterium]